MKPTAVIYDRYLSTLGGGELYAAAFATASRDLGFATRFLSDEDVDLDRLEERFSIDLADIEVEVLSQADEASVTGATVHDSVFFNTTYLDTTPGLARWNVLVSHFPEPTIPATIRNGLGPSDVERYRRVLVPYVVVGQRTRETEWTTFGSSVDVVPSVTAQTAFLHVMIPQDSELAVGSMVVTSGEHRKKLVLERGARATLPIGPIQRGRRIHIETSNLLPGRDRQHRGGDQFSGIALVAFTTSTSFPDSSNQAIRAKNLRRVDTFESIVCNSNFTRSWIERAWGVEATTIYPPVRPIGSTNKKKSIVSVGRFFDADKGSHYKGQRELVEAFIELSDLTEDGWSLTLAGGVTQGAHEFLAKIRHLASGHDIRIVTDISRSELESLLQEASIYWHATGINVPETEYPEATEHFGISTVEAMSAGAVPVVIAKGGQPEVVGDGMCGLTWSSREELIAETLRLMQDQPLLDRMSHAAIDRATMFSVDAFNQRVATLFERLDEAAR